MKKILFIAMAFASMFFASCMGDGYADPDNTIKVPAAPVGDNNIKEKNVITIAQLKEDYRQSGHGCPDDCKSHRLRQAPVSYLVQTKVGDHFLGQRCSDAHVPG